MATATLTLGSQNRWLADGSTTIWNFNFIGGYISTATVFAYSMSTDTVPIRSDYVVTQDMFVTPFSLRISPAVPNGHTVVLYRDSRNGGIPFADFVDGGGITEQSLDLTAKQAIFVNQETLDSATTQFQTSQPALFDQFAVAANASMDAKFDTIRDNYLTGELYAFDLVGDGSTDNTDLLTTWIAKAKAKNAILVLPAGSFVFSNTLTIDFPFQMRGCGRDKTFLFFNNAVAGKTAIKFIRNSRRSTISNLCLADNTFGISCGIELIDSLGGTGVHVQKLTFIDVEVDCFALAHKYTSANPLSGTTHAMCSETLWLHCRFCNNVLVGLNQNCQAVNNLYLGTDFENFDTVYHGTTVVDNFNFFKDEAGCGIAINGGSMVGRGKWFEWEYKTGGSTLFSGAQFTMQGVRIEARSAHNGVCLNEMVHAVTGSLALDITLRDLEVIAFNQNIDLLRYGGRLDFKIDNVNTVQGTGSLTIRQYPTVGRTSNSTTASQGTGKIDSSDIDIVVETTSPYGTWNANFTGLIMRDGCASSSTNSSMVTDAQGFSGLASKGNAQQMGMQLNDSIMPKMLVWNNDTPGNTVSGDLKLLVPKGGRPIELVVFKQPQAVTGDSGWELYVVKDNANWANPASFSLGTDATLVATTGVTTNKSGFFRVPVVLTVSGFTGPELRSGKTGWLEGRIYFKKTGATAFPGWFGISYL